MNRSQSLFGFDIWRKTKFSFLFIPRLLKIVESTQSVSAKLVINQSCQILFSNKTGQTQFNKIFISNRSTTDEFFRPNQRNLGFQMMSSNKIFNGFCNGSLIKKWTSTIFKFF